MVQAMQNTGELRRVKPFSKCFALQCLESVVRQSVCCRL